MTPLFKKLNFKDQDTIYILNPPGEFGKEQKAIEEFTSVRTGVGNAEAVEFVLCFVQTKAEVDELAPVIDDKLEGDGIVWFAYPKKSSKKYDAEISRDYGWEALGRHGFEPVRQVAVNEDWSALRFRRVKYIKNLKRNPKMAITKEGKKRTEGKN